MSILYVVGIVVLFAAVCFGIAYVWQRWENNTEGMTPEQAAARKRQSKNIMVGVVATGVALNAGAAVARHGDHAVQNGWDLPR